MLLHQTQREVLREGLSHFRFCIICGGRRWGKTCFVCELLFAEMINAFQTNAIYDALYIATTRSHTRRLMWRPLLEKFKENGIAIKSNNFESTIMLGDDQNILLHGFESIEKVRGGAYNLIVLDEVAEYNTKDGGNTSVMDVWDTILRPTLIDRKGKALFLSTPKGNNHFKDLYEMEKTNSEWKSFHFTTFDNPTLPAEEIEAFKKDDSKWARQEYHAEFVEGVEENALIDDVLIADAQERLKPQNDTDPQVIGLDASRSEIGGDSSVFVLKQGMYAEILEIIEHKVDTMELAGMAVGYLNRYPDAKIHMENVGLGVGTYDRLIEMGYRNRVIGINPTEKCDKEKDQQRYRNKRALGWVLLKEWLEDGGALKRNDRWNELSKPRFSYASNGTIKIESKESMRRRGIGSTDVGDALVIAGLAKPQRRGYTIPIDMSRF